MVIRAFGAEGLAERIRYHVQLAQELERTVLDPRDGRPVNAHMSDYLVPVCLDTPQLEVHFVPEEDRIVNPVGAEGLGEIALVGVAPAIANAVHHATGRRVRELSHMSSGTPVLRMDLTPRR
jgi:hypothetical protein